MKGRQSLISDFTTFFLSGSCTRCFAKQYLFTVTRSGASISYGHIFYIIVFPWVLVLHFRTVPA